MYVAGILLIIVVVGVVLFFGAGLLNYFSSENRAVRSGKQEVAKELASARRQLQVARATLTKIAANDSGNPVLDAQIVLSDLSNMELKELEPK